MNRRSIGILLFLFAFFVVLGQPTQAQSAITMVFDEFHEDYAAILRKIIAEHEDWEGFFERTEVSPRYKVELYFTPQAIVAWIPYQPNNNSLVIKKAKEGGAYAASDDFYALRLGTFNHVRTIIETSLAKAGRENPVFIGYRPNMLIGYMKPNNDLLYTELSYVQGSGLYSSRYYFKTGLGVRVGDVDVVLPPPRQFNRDSIRNFLVSAVKKYHSDVTGTYDLGQFLLEFLEIKESGIAEWK